VKGYDRDRILHLEERFAEPKASREAVPGAELEMLADLYLQADSHLPALELIERLLALPAAGELGASHRAALTSKAIACRLAAGDANAALAQVREVLVHDLAIDSQPLRVKLHLQCFEALYRLSRYEDARTSADRASAIAEQSGHVPSVAAALTAHGRVAQRLGDPLRAREAYEDALALYRRLGDDASCAVLRNNLGLLHKNLCEWDSAVSHLRGALEIQRRQRAATQHRCLETRRELVDRRDH